MLICNCANPPSASERLEGVGGGAEAGGLDRVLLAEEEPDRVRGHYVGSPEVTWSQTKALKVNKCF